MTPIWSKIIIILFLACFGSHFLLNTTAMVNVKYQTYTY